MASRKLPSGRGPVSDKISIDDLAKMFELPDFEDLEEGNLDYISDAGSSAYREAREDEELSMSKAEEARHQAETDAQTELYKKWHDAVLSAASTLFEHHHLALRPLEKRRGFVRPHEYRVVPLKGVWITSLRQIIATINGVGMFHFSSPAEFLSHGPYPTERVAVLNHLHQIKNYPAVYGSASADRLYQRAFRR